MAQPRPDNQEQPETEQEFNTTPDASSNSITPFMSSTEYEDLLPVMADKLDVETFMSELCTGFMILADPTTGLITPDSLRKNSRVLGMDWMNEEDAEAMVREGDVDRDGALNENEFCVLMVRLSPGMMDEAEDWLGKAIDHELLQPAN